MFDGLKLFLRTQPHPTFTVSFLTLLSRRSESNLTFQQQTSHLTSLSKSEKAQQIENRPVCE